MSLNSNNIENKSIPYFPDALLPLPPPEGLPVVLGAFGKPLDFAITLKF